MSPTQRERSSVLSTIFRIAKEHHQSVNAAHSSLYGGSSRQSSVSSTTSSASQQAHQQSRKHSDSANLSPSSTRSSTSTARPDHESIQQAKQNSKDNRGVDAYSVNSDVTLTATATTDSSSGPAGAGKRGARAKQHLSKGWDWVKERAKEHHRDTNAAYQAYYGMGSPRK